MSKLRIICIDLETSTGGKVFGPDSRDPTNDYYTIIYGDHPDRITVEHRAEGFKRTLPSNIFAECDLIIGHNLGFDLSYLWETPELRTYLDKGGAVWDTSLAEYLMSGQRHKFPSLKELQKLYLEQQIKEDRISYLFSKGIGADRLIAAKHRCPMLFRLFDKYCHGDGVSTLKVFAAQYRRAKEMGMLPMLKAWMGGFLGLLEMENTGLHVDLNNCEKTLQSFRKQALENLSAATALVTEHWDVRLGEFNINSPKHKSAILFGGAFTIKEKVEAGTFKNGNPKYATVPVEIYIDGFRLPLSWTKASKREGLFATDDGVINEIYKRCTNPIVLEYCRLQKEAMRFTKMASTYLEPFIKYSVDGVLKPRYNKTQTVTGRLSSSAPNMQNCPSSGDMLVPIQGQLIAPKGYVAVDIDFSQLEPFCTALLSNDQTLINDLTTGVCLHCRAVSWVPSMAEGKTYEEIYELAVVQKDPKWVLKRKKAKAINFKRAYGGGAMGLAEKERLPIEDVQAVFDSQDLVYSGVKEFNDKLFENIQRNQQSSLRRHFSKLDQKRRRFEHGLELLPIYTQDGALLYKSGEYRHFGTFISPWGRRITFEEAGKMSRHKQVYRRYSSTETKNYQIQSLAADVMMLSCADVFSYVRQHSQDVRLVRQIHDSLGFYVKEETISLHIPAICGIMSNVKALYKKHLNMDIPFNFNVEAKFGPDFANLEVYEEK